MKAVISVIDSKFIPFAVEIEGAFSDPVGIPSDNGSKVRCALQVRSKTVVTKYNIT